MRTSGCLFWEGMAGIFPNLPAGILATCRQGEQGQPGHPQVEANLVT